MPASTSPSSDIVAYAGVFSPSDIRDSTDADGHVQAGFHSVSHVLEYTIYWHSLTTLPVGMHFHDNGPIIAKINNFPALISDSASGSFTLTASQADDLQAGYIYVQIHTQKYPSGEILAYLEKQ